MDEFHGMGGSYVRDPVSGGRKLVERTKTPEEIAAETAAAEKASAEAAATKPKATAAKAAAAPETEGGNSQ